ncbi:hypothetical protein C8R44DRAFT_889380 [Mycena epipterygia]|nr:hypothetical protein C8R44DRAFT_889380 [Mycena epipterygia]
MSSLLGSDHIVPDLEEATSVHGSDDGNANRSEGEDNDNLDEEAPTMAPDTEMVVDDVATKTPKKAASRRKGGRGCHFAWKAITDVVASSKVPELTDRLAKAQNLEERRGQLTNYAWGGAPQLHGEIKNHSKSAVALYGIPGEFSPTEIVEHIKFLIGKKGVFKFGEINLTTHTYDAQQPYGTSFYRDVMAKQWFDTAKSEGVRAATFQRFIDAPIPTLALVTDARENLLKEWGTGVRVQVKFTEEEFGPRYLHHRAALRGLYSKIVSNTSFSHLKEVITPLGEDKLDGIDFDALKASAVPAAAVPAAVLPATASVPWA